MYRSFAKNLHLPSGMTPIHAVSKAILAPAKKETMSVLLPLKSDLLARLVVLPAASAEVERVFSSMKRIKTAQQNRLNTATRLNGGTKCYRMEPNSSITSVGVLEKQKVGDFKHIEQ